MNKKLNSIKNKTVFLIVIMLLLSVVIFTVITQYQNRILIRIVGEARTEQQQAISDTSEQTIHKVIVDTLSGYSTLQAKIADKDFSEIVADISTLQTMAQSLIEKRPHITAAELRLPDPALDGTPSAMVLCEEGVNYRNSKYLKVIGHMSGPMTGIVKNSDKISACYIGLADGTYFGVESDSANKYDENGKLIPLAVRQRPWYTGAVESGGIHFTGIEKEAFSGRLIVMCSAPVVANGETVGVVGIDIVLDSMCDFINGTADGTGFAFIVNENGQVIIEPENTEFFEITTADSAKDLRKSDNKEFGAFISEALSEQTDIKLLSVDGKEYYVAGCPMPTVGWTVITMVDKEATELPERTILAEYNRINEEASEKFAKDSFASKLAAQLVILVLFIAGIYLARRAAGRIANPLEKMTDEIKEIGKTGGLFEMKDCYRTNDEIEVLADAFDDFSHKNKQYIEDITQLTKEKQREETELSVAARIQNGALPHVFPAFPERKEFDIYAEMDPAREVGGDFYDFFFIDDDHLCLVMADVSGKGIPGALFMMVSKAILQNSAKLDRPVSEVLSLTNASLCAENPAEMFVTVWMGILEISTGKIRAANAGHEYPAVYHDGVFTLLKDKHGFVVGGMEGAKYKEYEIQLEPGDKIFVYTDGVPEATDAADNLFGTDRMIEALNKDPGASCRDILKNVRADIDAFVKDAEQFDDLTMMCIEYRGKN